MVASPRGADSERLTETTLRKGHRLNQRLARRRAWLDREVRLAHRRLRQSIPSFLAESSVLNLMTAPLIYSLVLPLVLLDLWVTVFQALTFRIYGIPTVRRRQYFVIDRHRLAYLNGIEKLHCFYCSYANGLFAYAREIAARTEQYWCPIKHARRVRHEHSRYQRFVEYGDAESYRRRLAALRRDVSGRRRL
jgi:hypothetical protein